MAVTVTAAAAGGADKEPVITATYNGMTHGEGDGLHRRQQILSMPETEPTAVSSPVSETIREPTRWSIRRQALISQT